MEPYCAAEFMPEAPVVGLYMCSKSVANLSRTGLLKGVQFEPISYMMQVISEADCNAKVTELVALTHFRWPESIRSGARFYSL